MTDTRGIFEHHPDGAGKAVGEKGFLSHKEKDIAEHIYKAFHCPAQMNGFMADQVLDWWHESSHSFYLREKQKKKKYLS